MRNSSNVLEMEWEEARDANNQRIFVAQEDFQPASASPSHPSTSHHRSSTSASPAKRPRFISLEREDSLEEGINSLEVMDITGYGLLLDQDLTDIPIKQSLDPEKDKGKGVRKSMVSNGILFLTS